MIPADAEALLVRLIGSGNPGLYGYDVYLPDLARKYLLSLAPSYKGENNGQLRDLVTALYPIAWDLCRRGVLRPGVSYFGGQEVGTTDGYSVTPFGKDWLAMADRNDFLPTEPGRFGQMLAPHRERFGFTFHGRAQEAMRCYSAHAHLACCVMCGAAAETILLTTAEQKMGKSKTEGLYKGAAGRSKVENKLFGQSKLRGEATPYLMLLNYWRNDAAHGNASKITENEAYTSLILLLRFAVFVTDNWDELSSPDQPASTA